MNRHFSEQIVWSVKAGKAFKTINLKDGCIEAEALILCVWLTGPLYGSGPSLMSLFTAVQFLFGPITMSVLKAVYCISNVQSKMDVTALLVWCQWLWLDEVMWFRCVWIRSQWRLFFKLLGFSYHGMSLPHSPFTYVYCTCPPYAQM